MSKDLVRIQRELKRSVDDYLKKELGDPLRYTKVSVNRDGALLRINVTIILEKPAKLGPILGLTNLLGNNYGVDPRLIEIYAPHRGAVRLSLIVGVKN